jgi:hypothetical protein
MAGFFNTSWDIGNSFNSPFSNAGFYNQDEDDSIVPRPGNQNLEAMPTNTWGAPTGYDPNQQQNNIFNPYSVGGNNFYNPYSFGQMTSGTQYGGGQQQPWWMNYNINNSVATPPNIPTTSVQPQEQVQPSNKQGTGPNGKDLTYDETIKYFGLYDGAENALAAGDKQAAYRQDHMQWRSGTGNYEGMGEGQGQYPGRPELGIAGDAERMGNLSSMFGGFNPFGMFNTEQNEQGGTNYTVDNEGTFVTPSGTTVETQLTNTNNIPPMLSTSGDGFPFGLKRGEFNNPDIFYPDTNTTPFGPAAPNGEQVNQTMVANDDSGTFSISDIPNSYSNINSGDRSGPAPTTQYDAGPAEMSIEAANLFYDNSGRNDGQARYEAGLAETAAARVAAEQQAAQQKQANIFLQNSLEEQRAREEAKQIQAYKAAQDRQDAARRQQAQAAAAQAEAQAKAQAAQRAQLEASLEAQRVQAAANAAAAESARQAVAAQARMNNKYETGPVSKNIFTSGTGGSSSGRSSRGSTTAPTTTRYGGRYGL